MVIKVAGAAVLLLLSAAVPGHGQDRGAVARPVAGPGVLPADTAAVSSDVLLPAMPDTPAVSAVVPAAVSASDAERDRVRERAWSDDGARIIVSVDERRLWWIRGADTLLTAPVAVGKGTRLEFGDRSWEFVTPPGVRRVAEKVPYPVWIPPEWHYVELAQDSALELVHLERGPGVPLADGSRVVVQGDRVGRLRADGTFEPVPEFEEVIYGDTLFVPPFGTRNREIPGELGAYALDIGDGFRIHGTMELDSIGEARTHGCIRAGAAAIRQLYEEVPVGTRVYIY